MLSVAAITWVGYLVSAWGLVLLSWSDLAFEFRVSAAFTCMLLVMAYMASEVTALREAFDRRRQRLNEAMEQLSELAMRDELTGLYNRRYIMDVLARQKALADRGHHSGPADPGRRFVAGRARGRGLAVRTALRRSHRGL